MFRTGLFLLFSTALSAASAQNTQFAQFVIKGELDSAQAADMTIELGQLLGVIQARVSRVNSNVVISSMPGIPILESEVREVMARLEMEIVRFRVGLVGRDPIVALDQQGREQRGQGNVQG